MFWMSAFIDVPGPDVEASVTFWSSVSGYAPSPRRGADEEFLTLVPPSGHPHLRMQRVGASSPRIHLDLHVPDPRVAADRAATLGAIEVADRGYVVMHSPGGLTFCLVSHPASATAKPARWPGGIRSVIDQVCIDIPRDRFEDESGFWESLLAWPRSGSSYAEFERLVRPEGQALRVLLQRVGDEGPVRAHLDLATTLRDREVLRHVGLGARVVDVHDAWTVLRDPAGMAYCLTDRSPG